jgi:hypothetical protein
MRALIRRVVDHILGCRPKQVARRRTEQDPAMYWQPGQWPPTQDDEDEDEDP